MKVEKIVLRIRHKSEPRSNDPNWLKLINKFATSDGNKPAVFTSRSDAAVFKAEYEASNPGWTAYMDITQKDVGGDAPCVSMSNEELDTLLFGSPEAAPTPEPESVPENF